MKTFPRKPPHLLLWLLLIALLLFLSYKLDQLDQTDQLKQVPLEAVNTTPYDAYPVERAELYHFIAQNLMTDGLVQTTLNPTVQVKTASGKDMSSESVGLMLLYFVETDQEDAFDKHYGLARTQLQKKNGLYQWRTRSGQAITSNVTVDDLRIAKALMMASEKWKRTDFQTDAAVISKSLLIYCTKDHQLLTNDASDAAFAKFYYYDFKAMALLSKFDPEWQSILTAGANRIKRSRVQFFPFYEVSSTNKTEYNMTENALIVLHLVEVGQINNNDLRWLRFNLGRGPLFTSYNIYAKPQLKTESVALYGIAAQIGKMAGDKDLYDLSTKHLTAMQVQKTGQYYGGFVDSTDKKVYAIDQLMALLGY